MEEAKLEGITPHSARHTYASLMIAAGVNAKALSEFMGHSSTQITLDRYGHLFPGSRAEAAGLLDDYLGRGSGLERPGRSLGPRLILGGARHAIPRVIPK